MAEPDNEIDLTEWQRRNWRPIETAPKDGTEVLLAGAYKANGKWDYAVGCYLQYRKGWPYLGEKFPTHWQPLPAPPTNPIPKGE